MAHTLSADFAIVKLAVDKLVSESSAYFTQELNTASFALVTGEGTHREQVEPNQVTRAFDLIQEKTLQIQLLLSVVTRTSNLGLPRLSEEYVSLGFDLTRNEFSLRVSIIGLEKAQKIEELLTAGIKLVRIQLPDQHKYLQSYLHEFLRDHPATEHNLLLIMRFKDESPFLEIVEAIRATCAAKGLDVIRADDKEYTDDLWDNVLTYIYGCDSAIAVFDQINYREFNPNVALEVGFLLAQCKRVLLLKDKAIPVMPADIAGKIYRNFDSYAAAQTIPPQIKKWLEDYGIGSGDETGLPV